MKRFFPVMYLLTWIVLSMINGNVNADPIAALQNAFYPRAVMDSSNAVICTAIDWAVPYSATVQKIDNQGNRMWANKLNGLYLTQPQFPEYAFLEEDTPFILPAADGGAYFAYAYTFWEEFTFEPRVFKSWPFIQRVDATGNVLWGRCGVQLSNREIVTNGGSAIEAIDYAGDGDLLVIWSWFAMNDSTSTREYGTYIQKIDKETGECRYGPEGRQILNTGATCQVTPDLFYLVHDDSVLCLNKDEDALWHLGLLSELSNIHDTYINITVNDSGNTLILYCKEDNIYGLLFDKQGVVQWNNKLILPDKDIFFHSFVSSWGNGKWCFIADGSLYFIDRDGNLIWEEGLSLPVQIIKYAAMIDDTLFYCLTKSGPHVPEDSTRLLLYKVDHNKNLLWGEDGLIISEKIDTHFYVFTDNAGDAIVVFEANSISEPEIRPRGTYIQKVDKYGNTGFITAINERHQNTRPSVPASYGYSWPNPFTDYTLVRIEGINVQPNSPLTVKIYNILGEEVKSIATSINQNSKADFYWNGTDKKGNRVAAGLYFYAVMSDNKLLCTGKLLKRGLK